MGASDAPVDGSCFEVDTGGTSRRLMSRHDVDVQHSLSSEIGGGEGVMASSLTEKFLEEGVLQLSREAAADFQESTSVVLSHSQGNPRPVPDDTHTYLYSMQLPNNL